MLDSYNANDYYTVAQVAKMLDVSKQTINNRCKNGHYEGAFKSEPNKEIGDPHGMWLIPKSAIDTPHIIQDVAILTRQINPAELQRIMNESITNAVMAAVEPLNQKIAEQNEIIQQLKIESQNNHEEIKNGMNNLAEIIETRTERLQKKNKSWWPF